LTETLIGFYNHISNALTNSTPANEVNIMKTFIITAAGGNATAIRVIEQALSRSEYERDGTILMAETEPRGAEQCGFLVLPDRHLEMSGGEFCGNASRAAAVLFSIFDGVEDVSFSVSGFNGTVVGRVSRFSEKKFLAQCKFPGLPAESQNVIVLGNQPATLIDLGGIVHVVIDAPFPEKPEKYQAAHRAICKELHLEGRDAVGVVWISQDAGVVTMHPVVWVRAINTFFYETSCGSGTIAVGKTTNARRVIQPTGQVIEVEVRKDEIVLASEMEVTHEDG
jgi:diaminopimelate epimerase